MDLENIGNMVEDLRDNWVKKGYEVNSDPAAHAIGLMVNLILDPENTTFIETKRSDMKILLAEYVFYSKEQVNAFLGEEEFTLENDPDFVRGYALGLSKELANDFYQAILRAY